MTINCIGISLSQYAYLMLKQQLKETSLCEGGKPQTTGNLVNTVFSVSLSWKITELHMASTAVLEHLPKLSKYVWYCSP